MHDDYDALDALRWSRLSLMRKSALAYQHGKRKPTPQLKLGTLAHALVLENLTASSVAVYTGKRMTRADPSHKPTKWEKFRDEAEAEGKIAVSSSEWAAAEAIAVGVHRHRLAREIIRRTEHEVTVTWSEAARAHKARIDMLGVWRAEIWDLKTQNDPNPRKFGASCARYLYYGQLAHYAAGAAAFRGWSEIEECGYIVVDSDAPHDVLVAPMLREDLGLGAALRDDLLRRLDECEASGMWPGAYPEPVHVTMPGWAYTGDDTSSEEEVFNDE